MASADALITRDGPVAVPMDYVVPGSSSMRPLVVTASFDGSAAGGSFVPVLEVIAPTGAVVARAPLDTSIAAGGSADVSWFPWWRGIAAGVAPSPNPLGTLWAWYDFADASTLTLDGSGNIAAVRDKTGNGHNLAQGTAAQRPAVGALNGLGCASFNHTAKQFLAGGPWVDSLPQPFTVALVFTQTLAAGGSYWPGPVGGAEAPSPAVLFFSASANRFFIEMGVGSFNNALTSPSAAHQITAIYSGGSSSLRQDGVATAGGVDVVTLTNIALGATHVPLRSTEDDCLNGLLAEVLYYTTALTAAQLAAVESYLKAKWGTP